jgi:hypothetical protein
MKALQEPNPSIPQSPLPRPIVGHILTAGYSDFHQMVENQFELVDKSMFIKDFMDLDSNPLRVIIRPRRFGKSMNLSMLQHFFQFGAKRETFANFEIMKHQSFVDRHLGQYVVLSLSLVSVGGNTLEHMQAKMKEVLIRTCNELLKNLVRLLGKKKDYSLISTSCSKI